MSQLLVALRGDRTQSEVAELTQIPQPRISRLERAMQFLDLDEAASYADALGGTAQQRDQLVQLVKERAEQGRAKRQVLTRSGAAAQQRITELVTAATEVRSWVPDAYPSVLQSPAYTAAVLDGEGLPDPGPEWWAARRARVALLDEPGRQWHELVGESAVRWVVGDRAANAAQARHVIAVSERPNVHLGYVALATPHPFIPPQRFHIYSGPPGPVLGAAGAVLEVATDLGATWVDDPSDVDRFRRTYEVLWDLASHGEDAREQIRRTLRRVGR
jgi:hypothetical protein